MPSQQVDAFEEVQQLSHDFLFLCICNHMTNDTVWLVYPRGQFLVAFEMSSFGEVDDEIVLPGVVGSPSPTGGAVDVKAKRKEETIASDDEEVGLCH